VEHLMCPTIGGGCESCFSSEKKVALYIGHNRD
jgi:hypothetical protein